MPEWLDESRIGAESQFIFYVDIFATGDKLDRSIPARYHIPRTLMTEATVEGKAPKARRGRFVFIDPEGQWPQRLANAGAWSNSISGKGKPNMVCTFGWVNLKHDGSSTEMVESLSGLILKTKFSIDEITSMTTIEVEFIEAVSSWFQNLRFLDPSDMVVLDDFRRNELRNISIAELLNHMWYKTSLSRQVGENVEFDIEFDDTGSDKQIDGRKFKIRYGDSFQQKLDEIAAQAEHTVKGENKESDIVWSYELIHKDDDFDIVDDGRSANIEYKCSLKYGWKPAPLEEDKEDINVPNVWEDMEIKNGPALLWKVHANHENKKQVISWNSDLNSKEHLIHQAQDQLTQRLSSYTESDWNALQAFVSHIRDKGEGQITQETLAEELESIRQQSEDGRTGIFQRIFNNTTWQLASNENRIQLLETLVNDPSLAMRNSGDAASQMAAIIANNVFKGEATIAGDPTFGTRHLPFEIKMPMDFEDVGEFAGLFQRTWVLTNVTHVFNESGYTTRLELLTYPEKQEINIDHDESAVKLGDVVVKDSEGNLRIAGNLPPFPGTSTD